jgi:hypothetical protein
MAFYSDYFVLTMANPAYSSDAEAADPAWKDITDQCKEVVNELFAQAEKRFGPRTKDMPVRVTEFSNGPKVQFINEIVYIRLGPGIGLHTRQQLRHQIAVEIVHALSVPPAEPGTPMTVLEEGAAAWFAHAFGGNPPEPTHQKKEKHAYDIVSKLLGDCPTVIKELRKTPRPICAITADEIEKACQKFPKDLLAALVAAW